MTAVDPIKFAGAKPATASVAAAPKAGGAARRIARAEGGLCVLGLPWVAPMLKLATGDAPKAQLRDLWQLLGVPLVAIAGFLALWAYLAPMVQTSLGAIPGPAQVWDQALILHADARAEGVKEAEFTAKQDAKNAELLATGKAEEVKVRAYTGKPTYCAQIWTSIQTVFFSFLIATLVAVPLGILTGLSPTANAAVNPLVQIFKPVSPLAWLPIVTMIVSAVATGGEDGLSKSFIISAVTVTLCSLWPTLINTALGVASIDKDLVNVGRVLKLSPWSKITRLVLPSALPLIFTGLRLSLGVGLKVLIAAEVLSQNSGLGKFVWDEFQNGSQDSLARIMVAVLTIGIIGFALDRVMFALQSLFTYTNHR